MPNTVRCCRRFRIALPPRQELGRAGYEGSRCVRTWKQCKLIIYKFNTSKHGMFVMMFNAYIIVYFHVSALPLSCQKIQTT